MAITSGCSTVLPWAAIVIGIVAGIVYNIGSQGTPCPRTSDPCPLRRTIAVKQSDSEQDALGDSP